ncbi:hypothetical protein NFIA_050670 [Paecilomyces variotii No. 5]|uniref:DEUBAD domain-containing protein n=1 Tax=Byssochlamys spectabilis (strain No. 5 / NBRC 109023) TaxID=1356009 RepID=V5FPL6_BYSSN|nr:hypothetical protein NFIA_050670 [Paecilomyces variotii No. 5]
MPPKRKAVPDGSTATMAGACRRSSRVGRTATTPVAEPSNVAKAAKAMPPNEESPAKRPKRNPKRGAKKDPWDEEKLLTSSESPLTYIDLVKVLAHPDAWNCLDEDEKKEILSLLPDTVHPNPEPDLEDPDSKIPPIPQEFLRYSNTWREGVRQFQVDLEAGRYDPEWLRQAADAMEERARGDFDDFKEQEFEEFWGQKQKLDHRVVAGESSSVKLKTLIEHGIIQKGDVWKYTRVVGKTVKITIEKEAKVVDLVDSTLTFAIPPGKRVFLATTESSKTSEKENGKGDDDKETAEEEDNPRPEPEPEPEPEPRPDISAATDSKSEKAPDLEINSTLEAPEAEKTNMPVEIVVPTAEPAVAVTPPPTADTPNGNVVTQPDQAPGHDSTETAPVETKDEAAGTVPESEPEPIENIILPNVAEPGSLAKKIMEMDGRIKNPPSSNAWKLFRCYRNNQDMGSLWEVRQTWYLKTH